MELIKYLSMDNVTGLIIGVIIIGIIILAYGSILLESFWSSFYEQDKPFSQNKSYYFKESARWIVIITCIIIIGWFGFYAVQGFTSSVPQDDYTPGETYPY